VVLGNGRARKTVRNAASHKTRSPSQPPSRDAGGVNDRTSALQSLRALVNALGRSARRIERHTGLTNAQLFVLRQIADATRGGGTLSVGDVAARALTRPSTASAVVSRLIDAGLVQCRADARDARRRALTLSARGRSTLARAPRAPTERVLGALSRLSDQDASAVANGLELLTRAMQLDASAPGMLFEDRTHGRQQDRRGRS
jgi:DNA-binding MarR family transcriptional regulator